MLDVYASEMGVQEMCLNDKIIDLNITQREGEAAVADLVMHKKAEFRNICIQNGKSVVFRGRQTREPYEKGGCFHYRYYALSINYQSQLKSLKESIKDKDMDPIFWGEYPELNQLLESRSSLLFINPVNHQMALSHILKGSKIKYIKDDVVFAESVVKKTVRDPLSDIKIEVKAEWIQKRGGNFNLFQEIQKAFPKGSVSTLTPKTLAFYWPKEGRWLNGASPRKTGYIFLNSYVEPVQTRKVKISKDNYAIETTLSGELELEWVYEQKRRENAYLEVPVSKVKGGDSLSITLNLNDLGQDESFSYEDAALFKTNRGKRILEYAKGMVMSYINMSKRHYEYHFSCPLESALGIDLDTQLSVLGVQGKVSYYSFDVKKNMAHITLSCSEDDNSPSFTIKDVKGVGDIKGYDKDPTSFVKDIRISNDADTQIEHLRMGEKLEQFPTVIEFDLYPLVSKPVQEHFYDVVWEENYDTQY